MFLTRLSPPGIEPVSLSEAKHFLRIAHADEDSLLSGQIQAARERVEALTGRALILRSYRETLDSWTPRRMSACGSAFALPMPPLVSVEAVRVFERSGEAVVWDPAEYRVDPAAEPGRLIARAPFGFPRPGRLAAGIEIDFSAGYGSASDHVPAPLREAVLALVARAYSTIEPAQSAQRGEADLPPGVEALLRPYQQVRL